MNRTYKIILIVVGICAIVGLSLFFGLFFGLRSSKSTSAPATTKELTTVTAENDFFPLNFTIITGANFTAEMKEAGKVVNQINSTDYTVYLGTQSEPTLDRVVPPVVVINSGLTTSLIVKMDPREFILYPKIDTVITVVYQATISTKITTENTKNSTVIFVPKFDSLISKLGSKDSISRGFSTSLNGYESTDELLIYSNSSFIFKVLSKDCISYESFQNIYFEDKNIISSNGNGKFPFGC